MYFRFNHVNKMYLYVCLWKATCGNVDRLGPFVEYILLQFLVVFVYQKPPADAIFPLLLALAFRPRGVEPCFRADGHYHALILTLLMKNSTKTKCQFVNVNNSVAQG